MKLDFVYHIPKTFWCFFCEVSLLLIETKDSTYVCKICHAAKKNTLNNNLHFLCIGGGYLKPWFFLPLYYISIVQCVSIRSFDALSEKRPF